MNIAQYFLKEGQMKTRVLLVDDEKDFVKILAERLKLRDFQVATAFTGEQALEKIKEYNYDVVILDVAMPGTDGVETLKKIKEIKPLTEVIMLTGHGTIETAIEGMKRGAFDFLLKPVKTSEIVEKINKAYTRKYDAEERIKYGQLKNILFSRKLDDADDDDSI